jgi:hypothetical protein
MKTKTFLLLCLFLGIGLTQLSAQNGKNGTGTDISDYPNEYWYTEVYCDGVQVDFIEGTGDVRIINQWVDGVWQWQIASCSGVGTSDWTGETFTFKERVHFYYNNNKGGVRIDDHVQGDKGSLYNMTFIINTNDWTMSVKNASCTGNTK